MNKKTMSRRTFINRTSMSIAGTAMVTGMSFSSHATIFNKANKPAILNGTPVRTKGWPGWPVWNPETDEELVLKVLRSGVWSRAKIVDEFEKKWAQTVGAKRCLATTNGTHALITALKVLGIGPGDEVLTTPYTFIATIDSILMNNAMPIFVDVDPETFQIDPAKMEEKITPKTRAILPVHILGLPADMGRIMAIAKKHNLIVLEDACQAWLAEVKGKIVGTIGQAGCFSFQNSKHLPIGEGGAMVSDDEVLMDRAYSFHDFGRPYGSVVGDVTGGYLTVGSKCRMTEYQAAIGLAQLKRLDEQTTLRNENAAYLRSQIKEIPGIIPYRLYDDVTRAAFHLFPFQYKKEYFQNLPREKFLEAMRGEGIPCSGGYTPLNTMPYLKDALSSRVFQAIYPKEKLNFDKYLEENQCPANDLLCQEAVWFSQSLLLAGKRDMDDIATAIDKIQKHADEIKRQA